MGPPATKRGAAGGLEYCQSDTFDTTNVSSLEEKKKAALAEEIR